MYRQPIAKIYSYCYVQNNLHNNVQCPCMSIKHRRGTTSAPHQGLGEKLVLYESWRELADVGARALYGSDETVIFSVECTPLHEYQAPSTCKLEKRQGFFNFSRVCDFIKTELSCGANEGSS